ncbi:MAG: 3-oxoacyl-ACP reductase FabG [Marinilabiliaceae bacterium]|nr:3-oxoacyl-ACP reductase FabG [Marinilabiliaceae bacterium]
MRYTLVTGASRGIGKSAAIKLAEDGFYVLINYRSNHEEAEATLKEIQSKGGDGELMPFDVSSHEQVEKAITEWQEKHPDEYIETLVNNAGITDDGLMIFMSVEQWQKVISTNLDSFFYVTRQVLQDMLVRKNGRVINVVSLSGQKGHPGQVNYSAAKAGVIAASKSLAMEIGKKKVTVNCVAPGFIHSDMTDGLDESQLKKLVPLNRFGKPDEVAEVISFLASEKSAYITGEVISVNGGMHS